MQYLTVAVATHARPRLLERALNAILDARGTDFVETRVLVVVNGPEDGYPEVQSRVTAEGVSWLSDPRPGLARARNTALAECSTTFLAYLDDDAVVFTDWFHRAAEALKKYPDASAIGGPYFADFGDRTPPKWLPVGFGDGHIGRPEGEVSFVSGGNMIVRCSDILEVGGFPENLGMNGSTRSWGEETSVFLNLSRAEKRVIFFPDLKVMHLVKPALLTFRGFLLEEFLQGKQIRDIFPDKYPAAFRSAGSGVARALRYALAACFIPSSCQQRAMRLGNAAHALGLGIGILRDRLLRVRLIGAANRRVVRDASSSAPKRGRRAHRGGSTTGVP